MFKTSPTVAKKEKLEATTNLKREEDDNKRKAKKRDGNRCRFPLCGCAKLKLRLEARLESSHDKHKGMGGNPTGSRNGTGNLGTLCKHRHQDGIVSVTRGTLRPKFLTPRGFDDLIAWEIDESAIRRRHDPMAPKKWIEIGREDKAIQQWAPFTAKQLVILERLAGMEL